MSPRAGEGSGCGTVRPASQPQAGLSGRRIRQERRLCSVQPIHPHAGIWNQVL